MAARNVDKKVQPVISQVKKHPSSSGKAERSKRAEISRQAKSASGPTKNHTDELLAKEEQYNPAALNMEACFRHRKFFCHLLLNAELEAKTADLVRQAEQLMREQSEVLSKPLTSVLLIDAAEEKSRVTEPQTCAVQEPGVKETTKKSVASRSQKMLTGNQVKESRFKTGSSEVSKEDDFEAVEDPANLFLAKTIQSMEEKMNNGVVHESVVDEIPNSGDNVGSGGSEAQIRVLKAKLRIMQEELDQISCEYYKKDDENTKLSAKIKELEDDRARLQRTVSVQQTQIGKHRALAEESAKKCDGLQLQVSGLSKEIEKLNRSHKQAAAGHSTVEVRLNRALEEVERLKTQLSKMKQEKKDKMTEEHQSKENLLAENTLLKKQKAELIVGFKKQMKLIDILKRQKMHFEAAKLLSFTEEEFVKALDWGKS